MSDEAPPGPGDRDDRYDVVVVGAGPVGENAAAGAAAGGLRVALVEADLLGGECSYWACIPSKALLRPGSALAAARRVPGAAQAVRRRLDASAVFAHRDELVHRWDDTPQLRWARDAGLTVIRGYGRLAGERRVRVETPGDREIVLSARHAVVLCTGSAPVSPPVPGLADTAPWGSREATSASTAPKRLAVIGGGVVASELAQAFARLGSTVTVLVRGKRLLERMEPFAGDAVAAGLRADGVDLRFGTEAERVSGPGGRSGDGPVRLNLTDGDELRADRVLVATGRGPATHDLGLDSVGLPAGQPLQVSDDGLVQGVPGGWLYAAGDVTGRAPLTHQGKYAARVVGDVVAARAAGGQADPRPWSDFAATADHCAVPQVVFTDPEVATVGSTAEDAARAGMRTRVIDLDIEVAGALLHAEHYQGRVRMVVDEDRQVVAGMTFVGPDVAEMLHAATVAVVGEVRLDRLWHAVPAFPTMSEVWLRLLEAYRG